MSEKLRAERPLHPCVCILSALTVFCAGMMLAKEIRLPVIMAGLVLLYCLFGLGKQTICCLGVMAVGGAVIALVTLLVRRQPDMAVQMWARVILAGLAVLPVLTMPHINLVRWLTQCRCPRAITLGMLIAVRFFPVLGREVARVREAMRTRGVRASLWNIRCFYRALVMPLMLRIINLSDGMALSLETRGFDLEDKDVTVYRPVSFTFRDGAYCLCTAAILTGVGVAL